MKKLILFLAVVLCLVQLLPAQVSEWPRHIGNTGFDSTAVTTTDRAGNVYVTGFFTGSLAFGTETITSTSSGYDAFLVKYDSNGRPRWVRQMGPLGVFADVAVSAGGDVYVTGSFSGMLRFGNAASLDAGNSSKLFIAKYNAAGQLQWARKAGGSVYESAQRLLVKADGNVLLAGLTESPDADFGGKAIANGGLHWPDAFSALYSPSGDALAAQILSEDVNSMLLEYDAAGNLYGIISNISEANGNSAIVHHLSKFNAAGELLLKKQAATGNVSFMDLAADVAGNLYATGTFVYRAGFGSYTFTQTSHEYSAFVVKFGADGEPQWARKAGDPPGSLLGVGIATVDGQNVFMTGTYYGGVTFEGKPLSDDRLAGIYLAKYAAGGEFKWVQSVMTAHTGQLSARGISLDSDQNSYITGKFYGDAKIGNTTLVNRGASDLFVMKVPDAYNTITGKIFVDANGNGVQDTGERNVTGAVVEVTPGPVFANTDANGAYVAYTKTGTYSVALPNPPKYHTVSPAAHTAAFTLEGQTDAGNHFALRPAPDAKDVSVALAAATSPRPSFESTYYMTIRNEGTVARNGSVTLTPDSRFMFNSSTPTPALGNPLTWNYADLLPGESRTIHAHLILSPSAVLGSEVTATAAITPVAGDLDASDNTSTLTQIVIGSFDPNDKLVSAQTLTPRQVSNGDLLVYTIRFQNKGTAEAIFITIKDTLSEKLDAGSFRMIAASHPYTVKISGKGALEWLFKEVNLPAEIQDEPASHGFVQFRIKARKGATINEAIHNKAYIYFDYNEAIITNTVTTTIKRQNQNVSFTAPGDRLAGAGPVLLTATASSGLPVTFRVVSGPATVANDKLTLTGAGKVTVSASQAGDDTYDVVTAERTFCALPPKPAITMKSDWYTNTLSSSSAAGNQWLLNGQPVAGATGQTYAVKETDYYSVQVTADGCNNLSDVLMVTAVKEAQTATQPLRVYPNPARTQLRLSYVPNHPTGGVWVTLFSSTGLKVAEYPLARAADHTWQATVDVRPLRKGLYLLVAGDGKSHRSVSFTKE